MPRGRKWNTEQRVNMATGLMEHDGWTEQRVLSMSKEARQIIYKRYWRKAGDALHDLMLLGLIEFVETGKDPD